MNQADSTMSIRAKVRRRLLGVARWVSRSAKLMAVGGTVVFGGLIGLFPSHAPAPLAVLGLAGLAAMLLSPLVGVIGMALRVGGLRRDGELRLRDRLLELVLNDGRVRRLGADPRSGVVMPRDTGSEVLLRLADGNELSILVEDEATAERVLDLADVGPKERGTRVRWAPLASRFGFGALGFIAALVAGFALILNTPQPWAAFAVYLAFVMPFIAATALSQLMAWREVEVGTDAITWRVHGRRTVLPMRSVRSAEVRGEALVINLVDGTSRRFDITRRGLAEGLRHRIEWVLAELGVARGKQSLFAWTGDSFQEWKDRMHALLDRGSGFRDLPVDVMDTLGVLEDPNAEPEMRVGAALALARLDEQELADKVRVVADTCVSPKLRVALAAAAGGDVEEEVVEAAREELRGMRA